MLREIIGEKYNIRVINDHIMESVLSGRLDLDDVKKIVGSRIKLSQNKSYNVIVFADDINMINRDALIYLAREAGKLINSMAIVIGSTFLANHIVNSFLELVPGNKPIQIFRDRNRSLTWLNK